MATSKRDSVSDVTEPGSVVLALSGGGIRATLFQLGILLYLASIDELKHVHYVVSVSGGSILAAHFAKNWNYALKNINGFITVAAELIAFTQSDIRNSLFSKWIWWHAPVLAMMMYVAAHCYINVHPLLGALVAVVSLVIVWFLPRRPSYYLEREYHTYFGETSLGDIPPEMGRPLFAFAATDTNLNQHIAITSNNLYRFSFEGGLEGRPVLSSGVPLSLAVTASSCFPLVFNTLNVDHRRLNIRHDELDAPLYLSDGGVSGNLGVQVLDELSQAGVIAAKKILVCDAERGRAVAPAAGIRGAQAAQSAALSAAARKAAERMAAEVIFLSIRSRPSDKTGLKSPVVTSISNYRTDLDRPSWMECQALLIHGAAVCHQQLAVNPSSDEADGMRIRELVNQVLKAANCTDKLFEPIANSLKWGSVPSFRQLCGTIFLAMLIYGILFAVPSEVASRTIPVWNVRPLSWLVNLISPEHPINADIDKVVTNAANSLCSGNFRASDLNLQSGRLYQFELIPDHDSSTSVLYFRKSFKPTGCDREIVCRFTFRGQFSLAALRAEREIEVIGRFEESTAPGKSSVYIDLKDARASVPKGETKASSGGAKVRFIGRPATTHH